MEITEIFYSLQGEGIEIGLPTIFIRTSGCNLKCTWCDTRYAWEEGQDMGIDEIMEIIKDFECNRVCVTGGEPLLQEETLELIENLLEDYAVTIETNGSIDISPLIDKDLMISMDYKTPSSKMNDEMIKSNLQKLRDEDQLKFIVSDKRDYNFTLEVLEKHEIKADIIFQPEGNKNMRKLAEWILDDSLDVRLIPQLQKIIWGGKRGV